jgi:thymidylate synthase
MPTFEGRTADEAWRQALQFFRNGGVPLVPDTRTGATIEVLHAHFAIADPRQRWVISRHPPINPAYAIAEVVWIVNGREDAAFPNAWNSQLPKYAGTGEIYHGAYGFRLRHRFGLDQIQRVYDVLRQSPSTRQAVLQVWDPTIDLPDEDGAAAASDIPCNVCALLKVRQGKLEWLQVLRSNDLMLGVPYNFIQFTTLQEVMAGWLGIEVGAYHHVSDSLHVYERDLETVCGSCPAALAPNADSLAVPKDESDRVFRDLSGAIEHLADPHATWRDVSTLGLDAPLPQPYRNLLLVVGAEAARRRKWGDLSAGLIAECTNGGLVQVWERWSERFTRA